VGATFSARAASRLGSSRVERFELHEHPDGDGHRTITRDVPRRTVGHLDERGLARVGRRIAPGAILIGAVRGARRCDLAERGPEEGLLRAIFGEEVVDDSQRAPSELDGEVIEATLEGEPGARRACVVVRVDRPLSVGDLVERSDGATAVVLAIDPGLEVDALWPEKLTSSARDPASELRVAASVRVVVLRRIDCARDVLHARSIGPYSTYTQQPLAGKPSFGGQRVGRAELRSLCDRGAWGLAHELVTVKSDDVEGRVRLFESIVRGDPRCPATRPEAAATLLAYLRACGLEVDEELEEEDEAPAPHDVFASFGVGGPPTARAVTLRFATTDDVRASSRGAVTRPDLRDDDGPPAEGGLLCARLFGPLVDYECACGALRGLRERGRVCERCGVEITRSIERRRRFAHVELAAPVLHPLAFDLVAALLAVPTARLRAVLAYETTLAGEEPAGGESLSATGAPAIAAALASLDLDALSREGGARGASARALSTAGRRPESLVVEAWPVLPADLRPAGQQTRTITDSLNDLYVRLVNRNARLARLHELNAPDIILRNEAHMLQRAVDALVENGRHEEPIARDGAPLRSLLHFLADPHGLVFQHLASKRVDYSAIAVAVPSDVPRGRVRMPRDSMRELLRPAIYGELEAEGHATSIKVAKTLVDAGDPRADAVVARAPLVAFPFPEDRAPTHVAHRGPTPLALEVECSVGSSCAELSAEDLEALELDPGGRVTLFLPIDPRAIAEARALLRSDSARDHGPAPSMRDEGWLAEISRPIGVIATRARLARAASHDERDPLEHRFARLVLGLPPS
jgi:hypothetical protein